MPCLPSMKSIFSYFGKLHISPKMDKGGQALLCLAHLVCHIVKLTGIVNGGKAVHLDH